jgi:hypothetical protein
MASLTVTYPGSCPTDISNEQFYNSILGKSTKLFKYILKTVAVLFASGPSRLRSALLEDAHEHFFQPFI